MSETNSTKIETPTWRRIVGLFTGIIISLVIFIVLIFSHWFIGLIISSFIIGFSVIMFFKDTYRWSGKCPYCESDIEILKDAKSIKCKVCKKIVINKSGSFGTC